MRATLHNGAIATLLKMYLHNISKYSNERTAFDSFSSQMTSIAEQHEITAIFYDEVHLLNNLLKGEFLNSNSSLLDLQVLLMEKLTNAGIAVLITPLILFRRSPNLLQQITLTTTHTAQLFPVTHSQDRMRIKQFLLKETDEQRLNRFKSVMEKAFGSSIAPCWTKYDAELKNLSGRALYLFKAINLVSENYFFCMY